MYSDSNPSISILHALQQIQEKWAFCPTPFGVGQNAQGCGVKSPGGGGAKRPGKNIVWAKRGKTPMWGKKPTMGQNAHGRFAPFCLFFGGNNDVIPCNIFVTHFGKLMYLTLKP